MKEENLVNSIDNILHNNHSSTQHISNKSEPKTNLSTYPNPNHSSIGLTGAPPS